MIRTVPAPDLPVAREGKHRRVALNPETGRFQVFSGDWRGGAYLDSFRQETYSFTLATISQPWTIDYPYCGPAGDVQPGHPDYNAWLYNTVVGRFFSLGGLSQPIPADCLGGATPKLSHMMAFDPHTKKWAETGRKKIETIGFNGNMVLYAGYDPQRNRAICFPTDYCVAYDFGADMWTAKWGGFPGTVRTWASYIAIDAAGRGAYVLDPWAGHLYRADCDTLAMTDLGPLPWGGGANDAEAIPLIYSPAAHEVRVAWQASLWRYNTQTHTWAARQGPYAGNTLCHDPTTDTTICFGAFASPQSLIYLYTPDTTPPVMLQTFGAIIASA